jgi:hypothetical protein
MAPKSQTNSEECRASKYEELQKKFERLKLDYEEKCNEFVDCENDLKAARMEIQELQILAKSQKGEQRSSIAPDSIGAGHAGAVGNPQADELRRLFSWLAEQVELEDTIQFDASAHNLTVAGQQVHMGNIVQWCLRESDLRLTVPDELASEVSSLLAAAKMDRNILCDAKAKAILDSWLLTTNEPPSETTSAVTLLTHRQSQVNCIVANFPAPHPVQEFAGFRVGDIVDVKFEEEWFTGVVKILKNDGKVSVQCYVDPPNVLTTTSISFLRCPVDLVAQQPTPEVAEAPQILEVPRPQPQVINTEVASNPTVPQSTPPQHKTAFSHARTKTCP